MSLCTQFAHPRRESNISSKTGPLIEVDPPGIFKTELDDHICEGGTEKNPTKNIPPGLAFSTEASVPKRETTTIVQ